MKIGNLGIFRQKKENGKSGGHKNKTERVAETARIPSQQRFGDLLLGYIFREEYHTTMRIIYSTRNVEVPAGG
jgi:hypothetical protein